MRIIGHLLAGLALALSLAGPAEGAADKPLVIESAKIKQLPAATTLQVNASGTGAASINIPHGTAPSSPVNGDCWTTTAGLYCQISGVTVGPMGAPTGTITLTGDISGSGTSAITTAIGTNKVLRSMLAQTSGAALLGATAAGNVADLSGTQATTLLDSFTSSLKGLAPASGGGTTNFLRADGTWAAPGGTGTVSTTGSPASGNLTKFSGAASITSGDLSGDVTTSGTLATTLAASGVTAGSYTAANITVDAKGRVTAAANGTGGGGGSGACTLITETVTSASATNVAFTSIVGTYRDLTVKVRGRANFAGANIDMRIRFNSDTAANYDQETNQVHGGSTGPFGNNAGTSAYFGNLPAATATASVASAISLEIADYRGTTFQKSGNYIAGLKTGTTSGSAAFFSEEGSIFWRSTAAITRIDVFPSANGFVDGSVVSLYGCL